MTTKEKAVIRTRRWRYGITDEQYDLMLLAQDGRCGLCHADDCALTVDHCHSTGSVRGLLCENCNTLVGRLELFRGNPVALQNWITQSTNRNPAVHALPSKPEKETNTYATYRR